MSFESTALGVAREQKDVPLMGEGLTAQNVACGFVARGPLLPTPSSKGFIEFADESLGHHYLLDHQYRRPSEFLS